MAQQLARSTSPHDHLISERVEQILAESNADARASLARAGFAGFADANHLRKMAEASRAFADSFDAPDEWEGLDLPPAARHLIAKALRVREQRYLQYAAIVEQMKGQ